MSELVRDVRGALRGLRNSPGFAVVAVLTLSLGIGATTAIFTVVESVLLAPLPYPEPERLVLVQEKNPEAGFPRFSLSPLNFRDYRDMSRSFEALAAVTGRSLALAGDDGGMARQIAGRAVTSDYLRVFGLPPAMGRDFTPEDDRPGAEPVILLGHGLWQSLGADPEIVGRSLRIDGQPTTVIGILPSTYPPSAEALVPLAVDYESTGRGGHWLMGFGRLGEGVSIQEARNELETIAANLAETYPRSNTGWGALVDPMHQRVVEDVEKALWMLMAAVVLVLLIACANVANLTLARVSAQTREMALRSALGASRGRLIRQLLTESLVLAAIAGGLGVFFAVRGTTWLVALAADDIPRAETIGLNGGVLAFAALATLGTALLFGLIPAVQASRTNLSSAIKEGGRGQIGGGRRLRLALVLAEVALALLILVGAGILLKSFTRLLDVEPGFETKGVWVARLDLPDSKYEEEETRIAFFRRLLDEVNTLPGVASASTVMPMPLTGSDWINTAYLEGEPLPAPNEAPAVNVRFVSPRYFDTMGIPLLRGRSLQASDNAETLPAVVINERAVAELWPNREPIGSRISFGRPDGDDIRWYTVVGVVGDVHHTSLDQPTQAAFYRPVLQDAPSSATLVVRTAGGTPESVARPLRTLMQKLDPDLPLSGERSAEDLVAGSLAEPRFNTTLLAIFAGLALALAAIGVFGVVSYTVSQRLREFGVRLALGARVGQIVSQVIGQGMRPVIGGIAIGLAVALATTRVLTSLVYGVSPTDPATFAMVGILLAAVAIIACLIPAWRATRVDPISVLRDE